jgi:hypothetical protein
MPDNADDLDLNMLVAPRAAPAGGVGFQTKPIGAVDEVIKVMKEEDGGSSEEGDEEDDEGGEEDEEEEDGSSGASSSRRSSRSSRRSKGSSRSHKRREEKKGESLHEKTELLHKLNRMERRGVKMYRTFTMSDRLEDIRRYFNQLKHDYSAEKAIKSYKQSILMFGFVTEQATGFLAVAMKKPLLDLDGWSEQLHEDVDEMDDIFEDLHDRYGSGGMHPLVRLPFELVKSAVMFGAAKSWFKNDPQSEQVFRDNPDLAKNFADAQARGRVPAEEPARWQPPPQPKPVGRMKGPGNYTETWAPPRGATIHEVDDGSSDTSSMVSNDTGTGTGISMNRRMRVLHL